MNIAHKIIPPNEKSRLKALQRYEILDTPRDGHFDRISMLASKMFNMPIAIISLVDTDRIWFKSSVGIDGVEQINRDPGLCASAILSNEIYYVENAIEDPRTLSNPLVCSDFGLRFYAAAPLQTSDGYNLGTLCVIDKKHRYLNQQQLEMLQELANVVVDQMEMRLEARKVAVELQHVIREFEDHKTSTSAIIKKIKKQDSTS